MKPRSSRGRLGDFVLWVSCAGLLVAGGDAFHTAVMVELSGKGGG